MSVAKRELKTVDELREWIERHAGAAGVPEEQGAPPYVIVRRPPTTGAADWAVVADGSQTGVAHRWSTAREHAIRTARLLFDVR